MKITILDEPALEFAGGSRHIDPRHGLARFGPADIGNDIARNIRIGVVGAAVSVDGIIRWLEQCRQPIASKPSHLVNLYPEFPGFNQETAFRSTLAFDSRLQRTIPERALGRLVALKADVAAREAAELYMHELTILDEEARCDVVICARPDNLPTHAAETREFDDDGPPLQVNFHDLLKARAMRFRFPLQIIRRETWDASYKPKRVQSGEIGLSLQDPATRAWNLHAALYYKAGGVPWRLARQASDLTTCFVGISFYRTTDTFLRTSVAQIFNERGDGVIVRGALAPLSKVDRQPHLTSDDARDLLKGALQRYRAEHQTLPARVVVHKTSSYDADENKGSGLPPTRPRYQSWSCCGFRSTTQYDCFAHQRIRHCVEPSFHWTRRATACTPAGASPSTAAIRAYMCRIRWPYA